MSVSTIHDILAQFRDEELHNRHLGDRFSNVWMWNDLSNFSLKKKKNLHPNPRAVQTRKQSVQRRCPRPLSGKRLSLRQRQRQRCQFTGKRLHADLDVNNISNTLKISAYRI